MNYENTVVTIMLDTTCSDLRNDRCKNKHLVLQCTALLCINNVIMALVTFHGS